MSVYLDVGGSKIYYETRGSGPAIILLRVGLLPCEVLKDAGHLIQLERSDEVVKKVEGLPRGESKQPLAF